MLARPLTQWHRTDLTSSISQKEAIDHLSKQEDQGISGQVDAPAIQVEQRDDVWYVLRGSSELDWLAQHYEILRSAIAQCEDADLASDIISRQHRKTS